MCPFSVFGRELRYHEYLQIWQDRKRPEQELVVPAWALLKEGETMEWTVDVPEEGLYNLTLVYLPVQGRGASMELELTLNGERPFSEAGYLLFHRIFGDAGPIMRDSLGNEIRAAQVEFPSFRRQPPE